jgi:hypothetical protein
MSRRHTCGALPVLPQSGWERKHGGDVVREDGGAADSFRLGMKRVLLSLWLTGAVLSASPAIDRTLNPESDDAMSTLTVRPSSPPRVQSTEIKALQSEVHSVVVDMPQVISLTHASTEAWGSLPTSIEQYDQSPTTSVLQLAVNQ